MEVMIEMRLELENGGTFIRKYPGRGLYRFFEAPDAVAQLQKC